MTRPISKSITKTAQKTKSNKITVITNHLKIDGKLLINDGKCELCNDDIVTIQEALVCRLNDYCSCNGEDCQCNDYVCFHYDWLNICVDSIVAYSILV